MIKFQLESIFSYVMGFSYIGTKFIVWIARDELQPGELEAFKCSKINVTFLFLAEIHYEFQWIASPILLIYVFWLISEVVEK